MIDNLVQFKLDLLSYLFGQKQVDGPFINLIRKHEKLSSAGDFSFPSLQNDKIWQGAVDQVKQMDENGLSTALIQASSSFALKIDRIVVDPKVVRIFLKRRVAFESFFARDQISQNLSETVDAKVINYEKQRTGSSPMSVVRCDSVMGVIKRIIKIHPLQLSIAGAPDHPLPSTPGGSPDHPFPSTPGGSLIGVSCSDPKHLLDQMIQKDVSKIAVKVGPVMTPSKQKEKSDVVGLLKQVEKEMEEVEKQRESQVVEGSSKLLAAAHVQFELLESNVGQPVVLGSKGEQSKVAFVLYNKARICQILRVFEEKVSRGSYPPLPPRKDIDWGLLTEEDEWSLLFLHLMEFSDLIKSISCCLAKGEMRVHKLCQFLVGLAGTFSRYYSRVRVLREPLPQLLPTLFARIHLLKAVEEVIEKALAILDIRTVDRM